MIAAQVRKNERQEIEKRQSVVEGGTREGGSWSWFAVFQEKVEQLVPVQDRRKGKGAQGARQRG